MKIDVLIIGGGVIGVCCAYELAKAGQQVTLLEKKSIGSGASGTSAAMVECQVDANRGEPFLSLSRASRDLFPSLYQEIKDLTGTDFQYERCGILELAVTEKQKATLKEEVTNQSALGFNTTWLEPNDVASKFPTLTTENYGGAFYADDAQVNGEKFIASLAQAARKKGATLIDETGPVTLHKDGTASFKDEKIEAKKIVIAAGAWSDEVLNPLGVQLGVHPLRGQLVVYDTPQPLLPSPIYTRTLGYLTPKKDGYLLAGSTVEKVGFDETPTDEAKATLTAQATFLVPGLKRSHIRGTTAGLRPGSPDNLPLIGPLPTFPHLIMATGHYRNGVLLAPITAKIVTALITNTLPPLDAKPYSPARL